MFWDRTSETMPREELEKLQLARLRDMVARIYERVPFYRELLRQAGCEPGDIKSLDDLRRLPFTTKEDLRENYPFGLFAVPLEDVVRVHASSGTTGKPCVVGYTRRDIETWADLMARALTMGGATRGDVIQNAYGYGLFTGGLGIHYGAERIGATVVPVSGGHTKRQLMLMQDFGSTVLTCTPSYTLYMAEEAQAAGVDLKGLKLKSGIFGAEPWSENMRREIEARWPLKAYDIYGLSEVMGPGVAMECEVRQGLHVFEDHFIPEIIDPATGQTLDWGQTGELVFTTLTKEAFPLLRYRTRDISALYPEPCACGRTHVRMARITGRTDDMLIIRGVNVFPSQIESVLLGLGYTEPHYLLVVDRQARRLDELEVWVELSEGMFTDAVRGLEELEERIARELDSVLGIRARVRLVEPRTIPRSEGKARRVVDRREL